MCGEGLREWDETGFVGDGDESAADRLEASYDFSVHHSILAVGTCAEDGRNKDWSMSRQFLSL